MLTNYLAAVCMQRSITIYIYIYIYIRHGYLYAQLKGDKCLLIIYCHICVLPNLFRKMLRPTLSIIIGGQYFAIISENLSKKENLRERERERERGGNNISR